MTVTWRTGQRPAPYLPGALPIGEESDGEATTHTATLAGFSVVNGGPVGVVIVGDAFRCVRVDALRVVPEPTPAPWITRDDIHPDDRHLWDANVDGVTLRWADDSPHAAPGRVP